MSTPTWSSASTWSSGPSGPETTHAVGVAIAEESVGPGFWTRCRALERRCLHDEPGLRWPRLIRTGYPRDTGGFAPWLTGTEDAEPHWRMVAHGVPVALAGGLILHHEGRLTLRGLARKRHYYGRGLLAAYRRAHPGVPACRPGRSRAPLAAPAAAAGRAGGGGAGIVVMRTVELAAYLAGALAGRRDGGPQAPASSRPPGRPGALGVLGRQVPARTDTVEVRRQPGRPTATAERPLATGKNHAVAPGTSRRPGQTSSESENPPTTGSSTHPNRGDHT